MRSRRQFGFAVLLLVSSVASLRPACGQGKQDAVAARLSAIAGSGHLEGLRWPDFSDYRALVVGFYRASGYKSAWIRDGEPTPQAVALIGILEDADREGLVAEDYDASRWGDRVKGLPGADAEARFDVALTVCVMRYVSDLHIGRVNPHHLGFEFDVSHKRLDLPGFVRERLVNGTDQSSELAAVAPPFPAYRRLRDALQHYMEMAKSEDTERLPYLTVEPGGDYPEVGRMAARLRLFGDLPESAPLPPTGSRTYDGALVDAVKHFQGRVGLKQTGVLDPQTMQEMSVPLKDRLDQMRFGLERYRWLPYTFTQPPVVVNVPEFRLYGFEGGGKVAITMRVNVGDEYDFQTPMFEKNMLYIVFRPYWTPPSGILRNEILPVLEKHPSLEESDLELVGAGGRVIRKGDVTPAMLQQVRVGKLSVRQPPGPDNSLGLVKFIFPNEHSVYIHDTPKGEDMFAGRNRSYSHGCIHAEEPAKLAAWLLRTAPGWNLERVENAMQHGRDDVRVNLPAPVPVLIVYQTVVVDEDGTVRFFHDIYGHDAELKDELAQGYPYTR